MRRRRRRSTCLIFCARLARLLHFLLALLRLDDVRVGPAAVVFVLENVLAQGGAIILVLRRCRSWCHVSFPSVRQLSKQHRSRPYGNGTATFGGEIPALFKLRGS